MSKLKTSVFAPNTLFNIGSYLSLSRLFGFLVLTPLSYLIALCFFMPKLRSEAITAAEPAYANRSVSLLCHTLCEINAVPCTFALKQTHPDHYPAEGSAATCAEYKQLPIGGPGFGDGWYRQASDAFFQLTNTSLPADAYRDGPNVYWDNMGFDIGKLSVAKEIKRECCYPVPFNLHAVDRAARADARMVAAAVFSVFILICLYNFIQKACIKYRSLEDKVVTVGTLAGVGAKVTVLHITTLCALRSAIENHPDIDGKIKLKPLKDSLTEADIIVPDNKAKYFSIKDLAQMYAFASSVCRTERDNAPPTG